MSTLYLLFSREALDFHSRIEALHQARYPSGRISKCMGDEAYEPDSTLITQLTDSFTPSRHLPIAPNAYYSQ